MTKNRKLGGNPLGQILLGSAIVVLIAGTPLFLTPTAWAGDAGYLHIIGPNAMDGASKEPAHLNWIVISSVVAADLNGDAQADRESSAPSVSEVTASHSIVSPRDPASGQATGQTAIGSASSGAGAGKVTAHRDIATGQASGKRMHKPFTITKEIDKASPMLAQACASGQHLSEVDVDLASGGHYKLTDVLVSSDRKAGGGDHPLETISFTYQKIEMK